MQVQQRHLPHVAGERVRAAYWAQARSRCRRRSRNSPRVAALYCMPPDSQTSLRVGLAQRGGAAEAGEQDPHLGGVQRRRRLVTVLQRVEQLGAQQLRQPGQGELVHPEPGPLGGDPRRQLAHRTAWRRRCAVQPLVVEAAQPAAGDALAVAAGDPALGGPGAAAGPGR